MSIDFPKGQFELFPGSSAPASKSEKRKGFWLNLTLTLDNLIIMAVVMIMAMVVSFSIGVEKGRSMSGRNRSRSSPIRGLKSTGSASRRLWTGSVNPPVPCPNPKR